MLCNTPVKGWEVCVSILMIINNDVFSAACVWEVFPYRYIVGLTTKTVNNKKINRILNYLFFIMLLYGFYRTTQQIYRGKYFFEWFYNHFQYFCCWTLFEKFYSILYLSMCYCFWIMLFNSRRCHIPLRIGTTSICFDFFFFFFF